MNLLPCPYCGEPAESDLARGFIDYQGKHSNAVAIYCSSCEADMCFCYGDFPQFTPEQLMAMLVDRRNSRKSPDNNLSFYVRELFNHLGWLSKHTDLKCDDCNRFREEIVKLLILDAVFTPLPKHEIKKDQIQQSVPGEDPDPDHRRQVG